MQTKTFYKYCFLATNDTISISKQTFTFVDIDDFVNQLGKARVFSFNVPYPTFEDARNAAIESSKNWKNNHLKDAAMHDMALSDLATMTEADCKEAEI